MEGRRVAVASRFGMRAVVQRTRAARVKVDGETIGKIGVGLMVLVGIHSQDGWPDVQYIRDKIVNLRIFEDEEGKMNRSVKEIGGGILVVSQFSLYGDARKGRRPSFTEAAPPHAAAELYLELVRTLRSENVTVETGQFGARMVVSLENEGPVTVLLDSLRGF